MLLRCQRGHLHDSHACWYTASNTLADLADSDRDRDSKSNGNATCYSDPTDTNTYKEEIRVLLDRRLRQPSLLKPRTALVLSITNT